MKIRELLWIESLKKFPNRENYKICDGFCNLDLCFPCAGIYENVILNNRMKINF